MKTAYADLTGQSGITHYDYGDDWVALWFRREDDPYLYPRRLIGEIHLRELKQKADAGEGVARYIADHPKVRSGFDRDLSYRTLARTSRATGSRTAPAPASAAHWR